VLSVTNRGQAKEDMKCTNNKVLEDAKGRKRQRIFSKSGLMRCVKAGIQHKNNAVEGNSEPTGMESEHGGSSTNRTELTPMSHCRQLHDSSSRADAPHNINDSESGVADPELDITVQNLSDEESDVEPVVECTNCHRRKPIEDTGIELDFVMRQVSELSTRRQWCSFAPSELVIGAEYHFCVECCEYLDTDNNGAVDDWTRMWPAYIWNVLTDMEVRNCLDINAWCLVPLKWRTWWLESLQEECPDYMGGEITMAHPQPSFRDATGDRDALLRMKKNLRLGEIRQTLNKLLLPNILCPWGCCE